MNCALCLIYIDTRANHLADSLSRDKASYFLSKVQSVHPPMPVSLPLLKLLLNPEADRTSPTWRQHFSAIFRQDWLLPHTRHTQGSDEALYTVLLQLHHTNPIHDLLLCYFASYLAKRSLAPQTIKTYLAAIRSTQISMGLPDPREPSSMPMLRWVQASISRIQLVTGSNVSQVRLSITYISSSGSMVHGLIPQTPNKIVLWAVAITAFFGFFRLDELL